MARYDGDDYCSRRYSRIGFAVGHGLLRAARMQVFARLAAFTAFKEGVIFLDYRG